MKFNKKQLEAYAAIEKLKPGQVAILLRISRGDVYYVEGVRFVQRLSNGKLLSEYAFNNEEFKNSSLIKKSCFHEGTGDLLEKMKEFDSNGIKLELVGVL